MKRPSFQFYPSDWRNNAKLRRCAPAARGVWMDVLCLQHDSDEYGVLRWPLKDIAQAAGAPMHLVRELVEKGVLKGSDASSPGYTFTPRHAGKDGAPVVLIEKSEGPCWYCSRMVRDEYIRLRRGSSTHFTSENQPPKQSPKGGIGVPHGEQPRGSFGLPQGDGPSSTSPSTRKDIPTSSGSELPSDLLSDKAQVDPIKALFDRGVTLLTATGVHEKGARSLVAKLRKEHGDIALLSALDLASSEHPTEPTSWLVRTTASCAKKSGSESHAGFSNKDYRAGIDIHGRPL